MAAQDASAGLGDIRAPINFGLDSPHPLWPPPFGLLAPAWLTQVPRDEWTTAQWREYAELRDHQAHITIQALCQKLREGQVRELSLQTKLRRSKKLPEQTGSLLDWPEAVKRGRPPGSKIMAIAERVLAKLVDLRAQSPGRRITREQALRAVLQEDGLGAYRARKMRGILNAVSSLNSKGRHK